MILAVKNSRLMILNHRKLEISLFRISAVTKIIYFLWSEMRFVTIDQLHTSSLILNPINVKVAN